MRQLVQRYLFGDIRAYPVSFVVAAIVFLLVARLTARRAGVRLQDAWWPLMILWFGALIGAKLYSLVELGRAGSFAWELTRGYRYPGAILGVLAAIPLVSRLTRSEISGAAAADLVAPALAFWIGVIRVGCLLNGCCHGVISALPWAITFPPDSPAWHAHQARGLIPPDALASLPVHPLQIYLFLVCLAIGALTLWMQNRKAYNGQVFLVFLALDNAAKFLLEFLRDEPGAAHIQLMSLALAITASVALAVASVRVRRQRLVASQ